MPSQTHDAPRQLKGIRAGADAAFGVLGVITVALITVQIGLAGLGVFGGNFGPHATLGLVIALVMLLMFIAALIARPNVRSVLLALLLLVLASPVQTLLAAFGWDNMWLGALHALNAVIILGIAWRLMSEARQRWAR